jgi:hypothetical protein
MALGCLPFCHKIGRCNVVEHYMGLAGQVPRSELTAGTSGRRCCASPVLELRQPNSCRGRAVMHQRTIQLLDGSIRSPKALICP